jgi:hypothetical protein
MTSLWKSKKKDVSGKFTITYSITYNMSKKSLRKEFLEWCDDYEPTVEALNDWLLDKFINPDAIDPAAKLTLKRSN